MGCNMKMRRYSALLVILALVASLFTACRFTSKWQREYELGVKYLSEGNYEEAVMAFQAAIDIDPKNAGAYVGLADTYIAMGQPDKAAEAIADAVENCGESDELAEKQQEIDGLLSPDTAAEPQSGQTPAPEGVYLLTVKEKSYFSGTLIYRIEYEYDGQGRLITETLREFSNNVTNDETDTLTEYEYDEQDRVTAKKLYDADGVLTGGYTYEYGENGLVSRRYDLDEADGETYTEYEYDENGKTVSETAYEDDEAYDLYEYTEFDGGRVVLKANYFGGDVVSINSNTQTMYDFFAGEYSIYDEQGRLVGSGVYFDESFDPASITTPQTEIQYDENGRESGAVRYNEDGSVNDYRTNEYDAAGNLVKTTYYRGSDDSVSEYDTYTYTLFAQ